MPPSSERSRSAGSRASQPDPLGDRDPMLDALNAARNGATSAPAQAGDLQLASGDDNLADILRRPDRPVTLATAPEPPLRRAAVGAAPVPAPQATGTPRGRQKTVSVSHGVRERFDAYRPSGWSNNRIVYAALNALRARYAELVAARHVAMEPEGLFGCEYVPGRRGVTDNPSHKVQLSFQPTEQERIVLERQAQEAGATSVSELIDAVLDEYLPPLTPPRRPHRATSHSRPEAT
jgi:hypothetical protein